MVGLADATGNALIANDMLLLVAVADVTQVRLVVITTVMLPAVVPPSV